MNCSTGDWACELTRIADAMNGFDWNSFAATLLATLIGAGVAAGVSFSLAARERPRPMWRVERLNLDRWDIHAGKVSIPVRVVNIGNGTAHNVRLSIVRDGEVHEGSTSALAEPGSTTSTYVAAPAAGELRFDPYSDEMVDTRTSEWPKSGVRLKIEWQQPPRLRRVRSTVVQLEPPLKADF